jgi:hypothetical protein
MKKTLLTFLLFFTLAPVGYAQKIAVKMNGLGLATFAGYGQWSPTPNLGVEVALWPRWTLDIDGYYNPFRYSDNKTTQFWAVQPELRFWFCRKFDGHFIGLHGQYADYNDGFGAQTYVYEGNLFGVGLSYGYVLPLAYRWKLEFNLGLGWNRVDSDTVWLREGLPGTNHYSKPYGPTGGNVDYVDPIKKDYVGITRAGISVIFVIR